MTDDTPPRSGSRWEPIPDETTPLASQPEQPAAPADQPAATPPPEAAAGQPAVPATPARRSWRDRGRGTGAVAAGAAGLVLVSGLGGVALGHATADRDEIGLVGDGFRGDGHGDGRPGLPGTPPGLERDGGPEGTPPGLDDDFGTPPGGPGETDDDTGSDDQTGTGATT